MLWVPCWVYEFLPTLLDVQHVVVYRFESPGHIVGERWMDMGESWIDIGPMHIFDTVFKQSASAIH